MPQLEHIINNRVIQNMQNLFIHCNSFFEKLIISKHFNCPSRLLDITKNPLIAAFFALDNYDRWQCTAQYGAINFCYVNDIKKQTRNAFNSDSISLLSALCTTIKNLPHFDIDNCIEKLHKFRNLIESILLGKSEEEKNLDELYSLFLKTRREIETIRYLLYSKTNEQNSIYNCLTEYLKLASNFIVQSFKQGAYVLEQIFHKLFYVIEKLTSINYLYKELQHQTTLQNFAFNENLPEDIDIHSYYVVFPPIKNERIKNQQGLFIFIINSKDNIFYNELNSTYGINKGFIYPEFKNIVNQVKNNILEEYLKEI